MSDPIDIALTPDQTGKYDINLDAFGDLEATTGFTTSIYLSLLTDERAEASEVSDPRKRRGYMGDEYYDDFKHGSRLWLLDQARLTELTRNNAISYAQNCFDWMVQDGYLRFINASAIIRAREGLTMTITLTARDGTTADFAYQLWTNTIDEAR